MKNGRGGKRKGSGRKPGPTKNWKALTTSVSPESKEWLDSQKEQGKVVRVIVDNLIKREMEKK